MNTPRDSAIRASGAVPQSELLDDRVSRYERGGSREGPEVNIFGG